MKKSHFRGHPTIWEGDEKTGHWVYADNKKPLPASGGEIRDCLKCGKGSTLGEGEVDPCIGVLPGVDNACCGHGIQELSYIRFKNGVAVKNFIVEH